MNNFTARFNKHSNSHLLKIIESKGEYQPEAIVAAKKILESRQLTEEEIGIAKVELANEKEEREAIIQKRINITNELKDFGTSVVDTINPVQETPPTVNKTILITSIVFGVISIYRIVNESGFLKFMFTNSNATWDLGMMFYFLPLLWIPSATVLFYMRKKAGWILLTAFITYSTISALFLTYTELNREPYLIPAFENLFPAISPTVIISTLLFFGGMLALLCKTSIRETYQIDKKAMLRIISISSVFFALFFYLR